MSDLQRWSQPVDATLYLREKRWSALCQRYHRDFTVAEKTELWDRWQRGESSKSIGRALPHELGWALIPIYKKCRAGE
jgi:hypothetical protein